MVEDVVILMAAHIPVIPGFSFRFDTVRLEATSLPLDTEIIGEVDESVVSDAFPDNLICCKVTVPVPL